MCMNLGERLGVLPSLFLGLGLFGIGIYALDSIVNNWWPFDVARIDLVRATALDNADAAAILDAANMEIVLAFLGVVLVTITGLALPLAYFLNKRFSGYANRQLGQSEAPRFLVTLRQSMWVGLWTAVCVWLQMNRALNAAAALLVAAVLVLFEILLQVRARTTVVQGDA